MSCMVLRCQNSAETVITDNPGTPGRRVEYAVCIPHADRISGGEEWRVQRDGPEHRAILMDSDLESGELMFSGIAISTSFPHGSETESRHVVTMKAKRRNAAEGDEEALTFEVNRAQFARLAKDFAEYAKERPFAKDDGQV
ncbi:hypothetical protein AB0I89_32155 [Micromonospora sp. NPDC049801]|uniref:hypothetical protein n=1 Tax=unclassified Micromonospora TaxID=2617518 RepID=UPI0033FA5C62